MFQFKSVFWINFAGEMVPGEKAHIFNLPDWADQALGPGNNTLKLGRVRKSIGDQDIHLIKINFDLKNDPTYARTIKVINDELCSKLELPAKIYIFAHCSPGSLEVSQKYGCYERGEYRSRQNHIQHDKLANIFKRAIPTDKQHHIVFHFLSCNGWFFADFFSRKILAQGFRNFFTIAYTEKVFFTTEGTSYVIEDFSTESRMRDNEQYAHHRDNPDLPDNKVIYYICGGTMQKMPYRDYIKQNAKILPADQRKNLFLYETDDTKRDLTAFSYVFGDFLVEEGTRMNKKALLSKQKGKNYILLGKTCKILSQNEETLTLADLCRILKITIIIVSETADKHRFIATKGAPKSRIKLDEFLRENDGVISTLAVYSNEKCGIKMTSRGQSLAALTPELCYETLLNGIIPKTR
ncbi:hypothetical protein AAEX28_02600 [Lentisphaerota bacterium WC36G]|nr:hypothetical protein LJT99_05485 [Lentisphaerae bacterium WC36]